MELFYDLRKIIGLAPDQKTRISQKYADAASCYFKQIGIDEEYERTARCGKHILAAVAFRENARYTFERTHSVFLPSVGNYYAYYHLSIAMLSLDYSTPSRELENVKHDKLLRLISSKLEKRYLINPSYLTIMKWLKNVREISNYAISPYLYDSTGFLKADLYDKGGLYDLMEISYQEAITFIHFLSQRASDYRPDFGSRIESFIADAQGDDILMVYFSSHDERRVKEFLENKFYPGLYK